MKSTPSYVPFSPKYVCSGNANELKPSYSEISVPTLSGIERDVRQDPLNAFLSGKLRIIEHTIRQITDEITKRELLQEITLDAIDNEMCRLRTALFATAPYGDSPFTLGDPRRRAALEKEIASLQAEKRSEETAAWKDIAGLKKELREVLREYLEERRKQQVMQK